jgi:hypothetical protein
VLQDALSASLQRQVEAEVAQRTAATAELKQQHDATMTRLAMDGREMVRVTCRTLAPCLVSRSSRCCSGVQIASQSRTIELLERQLEAANATSSMVSL